MKAKDLYPGVFSRHADAYQQRLEAVMLLLGLHHRGGIHDRAYPST